MKLRPYWRPVACRTFSVHTMAAGCNMGTTYTGYGFNARVRETEGHLMVGYLRPEA